MESIQSGNSTKKIQLPKLSFNDLIQVQQCESYKRAVVGCSKQSSLGQNQAILIEVGCLSGGEEELKNSELSVFRQSRSRDRSASSKQNTRLFNKPSN
jgi:hypothetical protein